MADHTHIEWTDATWNWITGCSLTSPGCTHCYAMQLAGTRLAHHPSRAGLTREVNGHHVWTGEVRRNMQWLMQPLQWKKPRRIFVCAHGDLFHESVPDKWIDQAFAVMAMAPQHVFQVLTKRSARMQRYCNDPDTPHRIYDLVCELVLEHRPNVTLIAYGTDPGLAPPGPRVHLGQWPLPNVWKGVSCEDQPRADERIPHVLDTLAAVRWVSAEPLLDLIVFRPEWLRGELINEYGDGLCGDVHEGGLDWIVTGGESGLRARGIVASAFRSVRDQCAAAQVAFLHKQNGEWIDATEWLRHLTREGRFKAYGLKFEPERPLNFVTAQELALACGYECEHQSDGSTLIRVGKKRAGRLLDGREHNEFPRGAVA